MSPFRAVKVLSYSGFCCCCVSQRSYSEDYKDHGDDDVYEWAGVEDVADALSKGEGYQGPQGRANDGDQCDSFVIRTGGSDEV